jgi:protein transport protein SEC24
VARLGTQRKEVLEEEEPVESPDPVAKDEEEEEPKPAAPKRVNAVDSKQSIHDNALMVSVAQGFYSFQTYTTSPTLQGGITKNVQYGDLLEGSWNYIAFGYKRKGNSGLARGYLQFSDRIAEVVFEVSHDVISDYVEFFIGREHGIPLFNGYMAHIEMQVGPGAFIASAEELKQRTSGTLP